VLPDIPTPAADIYAVYPSVGQPPRRILAALDHLGTGLQERLA
jgi:hypothetical protein